jgi:hypothetical protein
VNAVPGVGTAVMLRDQAGGHYRSRVEAVEGASIVLHPPTGGVGERVMMPGTRLVVTWPDEQSLWVLPVILVVLQPTVDGAMLQVEINGEPWREERRQYRRSVVAADVLVRFTPTGDQPEAPEPAAVPAALVNLSEVALRCALPAEHGHLYQPRMLVTVELGLPRARFVIPGYILQARLTGHDDLSYDVVILFDRPVDRIDRLRAHLAQT